MPPIQLGWKLHWLMLAGDGSTIDNWVQCVPPLQVDAQTAPQRAHGEYLAMTMCNECHGLDLRGQTLYPPVTPDLAMVAAISREDFETLITTGVGIGGRELRLMGLVAPDRYGSLTDEEVDALYVYLSSLLSEPAPENVFWRPAVE